MISIVSCDQVPELFERVCASAFDLLGLVGDAYAEFVALDEEQMRSLNCEARGVDKVTDVLSFPALDEIKPFDEQNYPVDFDRQVSAVFLGSIVVCDPVACRQAEEYGHSVERERAYLFLHGLLHLLGYDHIRSEDKEVMRRKEEEILSAIGITR